MLVCADSSRLPFPDATFDICITSPPYGLEKAYGSDDTCHWPTYRTKAITWLIEIRRVLKSDGRLCCNVPLDSNLGGRKFFGAEYHRLLDDLGYHLNDVIVWDKKNVGRRTAWGSYASPSSPYVTTPFELILVVRKSPERRRPPNGRTPMISAEDFKAWTYGHWDIKPASAKQIGHPAPFPIELPRRLLKLYAYREDLVLDPFSGSGTTGLACQELGVRYVGVDLSEQWLGLSRARLGAVQNFHN